MQYKLIRLAQEWYDFKNIPQGYIKIHGLNCGSEQKAINRVKRILKNKLQAGDTLLIAGQGYESEVKL